MKRTALLLAFVSLAAAQETHDGLDWVVALRGRFREMHNSVVATYALGCLASLVCAKDRTAGSGLFRESLTRLNMLPDHAFTDTGPVLPVSSFSGLWKSIMPEALRSRPRRVKFDPKSVRVFSATAERTTDSSLIVFGSRGVYEVVAGSLKRHQFRLQVPGVIRFTLPAFLADAGALDPKQLESAVLGLRDENRLASALNALAALRLK